MDCIFKTVAFEENYVQQSAAWHSLGLDISAPDCLASSRSLLIKVEYSNLECLTDSVLAKKLMESVSAIEPDCTEFQFPVGNCVVGSIVSIGELVEGFQVGDRVAALLPSPLTLENPPLPGGLSVLCLVDEYHAVSMPTTRLTIDTTDSSPSILPSRDASLKSLGSSSDPSSTISVVATLPHLIRAFTALHYQARLVAGDSVLLLNAGSHFGLVLAQLASAWGAKVLAVADNHDAKYRLDHLGGQVGEKAGTSSSNGALSGSGTTTGLTKATTLSSTPVGSQIAPCVIDISNARAGCEGAYVLKSVLDETNGVGVDCVIDFRCHDDVSSDWINNNNKSESSDSVIIAATQRDIISCLATGGKWITNDAQLQLDPPESEVLFLKGASISFLFDHWLLCPSQVGRFHHVVRESLRLIEAKTVGVDVDLIDGDWDSVLEKLNNGGSDGNTKSIVFRLPE